MRKSRLLFLLSMFILNSFLPVSTIYAQQNIENTESASNIEDHIDFINKMYDEYCIPDSEKNIDSEVKNLNNEKEKLENEIKELEKKSNSDFNHNNASFNKTIENNQKIQNEIDELYTKLVQQSNSSDNLSKRIEELDYDLNNERAEIDSQDYDSLDSEIQTENKRIRETSEQIKRRREESRKLKSKIILLDESLESYKIRDGFRDKFVDTYKSYYNAEILYKSDKTAKLVVLTQKIDPTVEKSKETGLIWKTNNVLKNKFNDCLIQYYIPLDNLRPKDIKYNFKDNCLIIDSPRPVLDEEMLFIQVDPNKIDEKLPDGWFKGGITKELKDEIMSEIKQVVLRAGRDDRLRGEAEDSARFHLENFFRGFMKGIKGSSDVKIKINFY